MNNTIYTIYKITNNINNKIYIGVHKTTNPNDSYLGSGDAIKLAVKKYGKSNFTKSILFEYDNETEAYFKESILVDKKFISRPDTYNKIQGGRGGVGKIQRFGEDNPFFNHTHSPKSIQKIKDNARYGKNNIMCVGLWITPFGSFSSKALALTYFKSNNILISTNTLTKWCKYNSLIITQGMINRSKYLKSLSHEIIHTPICNLGFGFKQY